MYIKKKQTPHNYSITLHQEGTGCRIGEEIRKENEMLFIKDLDQIREVQTVKFPSHDDVRLSADYIRGYVTAMFNYKAGRWVFGYTETEEDALKHYEMVKKLCNIDPDVMNWMQYSEMYIYRSTNEIKPKWSLLGAVVED